MIYPKFSLNAVEDRHRLPISEEVGTCGVSICFAANSYDHSSWRIIRLRAMHVLHSCVDIGAGIGGSTITGEAKHVEVTLYSMNANDAASSGLSLIMSNETVAIVR